MTAIEFTTYYHCRISTMHPVTMREAEVIVGTAIASGSWKDQCRDQQSDYFVDKTVSNDRIPALECMCLGFTPELDKRSIEIANGSACEIGSIDYIVAQEMLFFTTASFDKAVVLAIAAAAQDNVVQLPPAQPKYAGVDVRMPEKEALSFLRKHTRLTVYPATSGTQRKEVSA